MVSIFLDGSVVAIRAFALPVFLSISLGYILYRHSKGRDSSQKVRDREAFAAVALGWPVVVAIGALPYWFGGVFWGPFNSAPGLLDLMRGFVNSWFESMSGFTTTGATVISTRSSPICMNQVVSDCIYSQPKGILLWRSMSQWLGGMGIIMLGMAILSRIVGGAGNVARAELTGPTLSRLKPRLQDTAKALWATYIGLTLILFLLLAFFSKMDIFDSINHSLTTMPSGGFSTHDRSIMHYDSPLIEFIIMIFMFITGMNFTLIYFGLHGDLKKIWADEEFKYYALMILVAILLMTINLTYSSEFGFFESLRYGSFQVLSIGTSTGYTSENYAVWPVFSMLILFFLMIVGASAGSTSGGLKVLRLNLALKLGMRELWRITNPRQIRSIRLNREKIQDDRLWMILGMLILWVLLFIISTLLIALMETGSDFDLETIIGLVASALGNTGPALGHFGPTNTWSEMHAHTLFTLSILMWFGRLELLTVLILFHPRTWQSDKQETGVSNRAMKRFQKFISQIRK